MQRTWALRWRLREFSTPRLLFVGLGTIGLTAARLALSRRDVQVVAALEKDPEKVGKDLGFLTGQGRTHVVVTENLSEALQAEPSVALVATSSRLSGIFPLLRELIDAGLHVVASAEELFFPWLSGDEEVWILDEVAKARRVAVVGVGVNPGFVMDRLPTFLAQASVNLRRVTVVRVVDLGTRRPQLREKMGVGLTKEAFERGVKEGHLGHVGLPHSVAYLAATLGLELSHITETVSPITNERGMVIGAEHLASGWEGDFERVRLILRMSLGIMDPYDEIELDADPPFTVRIIGGIAGDAATAAILVNTATWVSDLPPGLHSSAPWFPRSPLLPSPAEE